MKPGELRHWHAGVTARANEPFLVVDVDPVEREAVILDRGTIYKLDAQNIEYFSKRLEVDRNRPA